MPPRRYRARRRLTALVALALAFVVASLFVGVVYAAHRDPSYRSGVDASFAAEASVLVADSNAEGVQLSAALAHPGALGRLALATRLDALALSAGDDATESTQLLAPPPDAGAGSRLVDVLRLRSRGVDTVDAALFGLLGLTPAWPVGTDRRPPRPDPHLELAGAKHLLRIAGEEFVLADRLYAATAVAFSRAGRGASLPVSRWITAKDKTLLPQSLLAAAPGIKSAPALQAEVHLVLAAVATDPPELPLGKGYPVTPTDALSVSISVRNEGNAPTPVVARISLQPEGDLGRGAVGYARGVAGADEAVALTLPTMPVVPGEHCLVTVQVLKPQRQRSGGGLRWRRVVVVAPTRG